MTFQKVKAQYPFMLCECGHRADIHLYGGDHVCVQTECSCREFTLSDSNFHNEAIVNALRQAVSAA